MSGWQIPASNPSAGNAPQIKAICDGHYPLYHKATQTVWVLCPQDNTIQMIYSLASPKENLTLSPAAPVGGEEQLYLPLVIKREGE